MSIQLSMFLDYIGPEGTGLTAGLNKTMTQIKPLKDVLHVWMDVMSTSLTSPYTLLFPLFIFAF